jgi:putative hydrolase of the HAD superfamily
MKKTLIGPYFDGIISAHQVGLPKEDGRFWQALLNFIPYHPERTMLGEDSETNLGTAADFNIKFLIYVGRYSSTITPQQSQRFATINYFSQLIPTDATLTVTLRWPGFVRQPEG